ncbi:MAG: hypothetical protein RIQ78_318 [Bacteroidota bacterium]|jgi:hypothetical protein
MHQNNFFSAFILLGFMACVFSAEAQNGQPIKAHWFTLSGIPLDGSWKPNQEPPFPLFTDGVKQLDGKIVAVEGFTIPLDPGGNQITLSANPFSACFFCGKAGPASIMTVLFDRAEKGLRTDDYIYLTGRMRLNYADPSQPYYTLEHAVLTGKK